MVSSSAVRDALQEISRRTDDDMSERDVENLFLETGFYDGFGYEGTEIDIRSEFTLPDDKRPDYITLDSNEAVTVVYGFKTTGRNLSPHTDQLFAYMEYLQADYGCRKRKTVPYLPARRQSPIHRTLDGIGH